MIEGEYEGGRHREKERNISVKINFDLLPPILVPLGIEPAT